MMTRKEKMNDDGMKIRWMELELRDAMKVGMDGAGV
jgi:hypothetical protein